jgi:hypothetical protein
MAWLETTFYYVRAAAKPEQYDFAGLRERVSATLESLVESGFVETGADLSVEPTALGRLTSKYYLRLATAEEFHGLATSLEDGRTPSTGAVLKTIARAAEFDSVSARSDDEDAVDAVLGREGEDLSPGARKVLAVLRSGMTGDTPEDLRGDAWVIRQNARRLLSALRAFVDRFAGAAAANAVARVAARVETGASEESVGLTAIDGVGAGRAHTLAEANVDTPAAVVEAGTAAVSAAGLPDGVAEQVVTNAADLPAVSVDLSTVPDAIAEGERAMCEVTVRNAGGGARAGVRATVNGREMTAEDTYLSGERTVPVAVFGAPGHDELRYRVQVAFPELPLSPVVAERTVRVE